LFGTSSVIFYGLFYLFGCKETKFTITKPSYLPIVLALDDDDDDDDDDCGTISGMIEWQEGLKYWQETCPSVHLSTTNPRLLVSSSYLQLLSMTEVCTREVPGSYCGPLLVFVKSFVSPFQSF
jgi:hypothetical protein